MKNNRFFNGEDGNPEQNNNDSSVADSSCEMEEESCKFEGLYVYKCMVCGQMVASPCKLVNPITCCGQEMVLVSPKSEDEKAEKHVPIYEMNENTLVVTVGAIPHPMEEDHHINWISVITNTGVHVKFLNCNSEPKASFKLGDKEEVKAIYAYCNIHGLWKHEV